MSPVREYDAWFASGREVHIEMDHIQTRVQVFLTGEKPVSLFVHGLGGDLLGTVPLAYELRDVEKPTEIAGYICREIG